MRVSDISVTTPAGQDTCVRSNELAPGLRSRSPHLTGPPAPQLRLMRAVSPTLSNVSASSDRGSLRVSRLESLVSQNLYRRGATIQLGNQSTFRAMITYPVSLARQFMDATLQVAREAIAPTAEPVCAQCNRAWRWPRNLAHFHLDHGAVTIKPTTQSTVVAFLTSIPKSKPVRPTIRERLFRKVDLTYTSTGYTRIPNCLVREFQYNAELDEVRYPPLLTPKGGEDSGYEYFQLVTLGSYYIDLFKTLLTLTTSFMDHYANLLLVIAFHTDPEFTSFWLSRYMFTCAWCCMISGIYLFSSHQAQVEWRTKVSPMVGDLVNHTGRLDSILTFYAMVFFNFFAVENTVKDIIKRLHPWKSIQPYAAVKINGTRAHVVGFMSEALYKVENRTGQYYGLLIQSVLKTTVFCVKAYVCYWYVTPSILISCFSSIWSVVLGWFTWVDLHRDRRVLMRQLMQMVEKDKTTMSEQDARQCAAAEKLLILHFGCTLEGEQFSEKGVHLNCEGVPKEGEICGRCGRDAHAKQSRRYSLLSNRHPEVGQHVKLSPEYTQFHDAKYGPLKEGYIGEVEEISPARVGEGIRRLVRYPPKDTAPGGLTWWYDDGALELVEPQAPPAPNAPQLQPGVSSVASASFSESIYSVCAAGDTTDDEDASGEVAVVDGVVTAADLAQELDAIVARARRLLSASRSFQQDACTRWFTEVADAGAQMLQEFPETRSGSKQPAPWSVGKAFGVAITVSTASGMRLSTT